MKNILIALSALVLFGCNKEVKADAEASNAVVANAISPVESPKPSPKVEVPAKPVLVKKEEKKK